MTGSEVKGLNAQICLRTNSPQSQCQGSRDKKRQHGGRGRKDRKTLGKRRALLEVMRWWEARMPQGTGQRGWPVGMAVMMCAWPSQESVQQICAVHQVAGSVGCWGFSNGHGVCPLSRSCLVGQRKCVGTQCSDGQKKQEAGDNRMET